jgi:hypothetical protein
MIRRGNEEGHGHPGGGRLDAARRLILTLLTVEVGVLAVSGIALFFAYRPSVSQAWSDVVVSDVAADVRISQALRGIHLLASRLAVATAIAAAVVLVLRSRSAARRWPGTATGIAIATTTLAASFTGFLLPWDQLALWAVTIGSNMNGYIPLFGDNVRFVLIGGVEVTAGTIRLWLLVHMLLLGPALAVLVVLAWRSARRRHPSAGISGSPLPVWLLMVLPMALVAAGCADPEPAASIGRALPEQPGPPPVIDAHDGSVVQDGGTFWIFGTSYDCGFGLNKVGTRWCGIKAFSSTDLVQWTGRGFAITPDAVWQQRCAPPRFGCFRPHVARSPATGEWVLWVNTFDSLVGYRVLVAPSPAGPWREIGAPALAVGGRGKLTRGDHDVFVDAGGRGWLAYTLIEGGVPTDIVVERLNPELTSGTGEAVTLGLGVVEAPSLFEREGKFLLTYSDPACPYCPAGTGLASAPSPLGPWRIESTLSTKSCDGQPAEVSQLRMADGPIWLYVSDQWRKGNPNQAGATLWWEPLSFRSNGLPVPPRCVPPSGAGASTRLAQ